MGNLSSVSEADIKNLLDRYEVEQGSRLNSKVPPTSNHPEMGYYCGLLLKQKPSVYSYLLIVHRAILILLRIDLAV
jgi:hypothetical protein